MNINYVWNVYYYDNDNTLNKTYVISLSTNETTITSKPQENNLKQSNLISLFKWRLIIEPHGMAW